jgi:hypothetical protein
MPPPYSGDHPRAVAASVIVLVVFLIVLGSPEIQSALIQKMPWLSPFFVWQHHFQKSN